MFNLGYILNKMTKCFTYKILTFATNSHVAVVLASETGSKKTRAVAAMALCVQNSGDNCGATDHNFCPSPKPSDDLNTVKNIDSSTSN
jgi:hypothetical protein